MGISRDAPLAIEIGRRLAQTDTEKNPNAKASKNSALEVVYHAYSQENFKAAFTISAINPEANQYESLFVFQDNEGRWYVDAPLNEQDWRRVYTQKAFEERKIKVGPDLDSLIQQFNVKGLDFPNKTDIDRLAAEDDKFSLAPVDKEPLPTARWSPPKIITEFKKENGVTSARAISFGPSPS